MLPVPIVNALARAFVTSEPSVEALVHGASTVVRGPKGLLRALAARYLTTFVPGVRPRLRDVVALLRHEEWWEEHPEWVGTLRARYRRRVPILAAPSMQPATPGVSDALPALVTVGELADWLGISIGELLRFADTRDLNRRAGGSSLGHYHWSLRAKAHGGVRLIESPQRRLKVIQRRILEEILDRVPPYYDAAHGFVKGRSVHTFAAPHVRRAVVLRLDLADFFPCISGVRVQTVFRTLGYPEAVADLLGGLCTTTTPRHVFLSTPHPVVDPLVLAEASRVYRRPHLPQGAPTSPALANLCAFRLDCRLTGLADWAGAVYTRYADDLAFSGDGEFARHVDRYAVQIAAIALDEGWQVQHHKTRVMRQGARQQLAGLVVNAHVNTSRAEYDQLRATLTNCVRLGPDSQNREGRADFRAHLAGRVAWVASINPPRGARLQALLARVAWP